MSPKKFAFLTRQIVENEVYYLYQNKKWYVVEERLQGDNKKMSILVKILLQNKKVDIARSIYIRQNLQGQIKDKRLKNCENLEFNYFSNMIFDRDYFAPTEENIQLA